MHTKLLNTRFIATSLINKHSFNGYKFVTPKSKVSFFDWNKQENEGLLSSAELDRYDTAVRKYGINWGCLKDVRLNANVTNFDYESKQHFISVLSSYKTCNGKGDNIIIYCIDKINQGNNEILTSLEFKTIKECKEYIKCNQHKL